MSEPTPRRVVVVGTGLIGTSVCLALRERGAEVLLEDRDPGAVRLAEELGAGRPWDGGAPADLAVLAVPPGAVGETLRDVQRRGLARAYTDVASVKALPLADAARLGCDLATFVGGHPLGGRERSGPAAARADLFLGRAWVLCPTPDTRPDVVETASGLVRACRAEPVVLDADTHDHAVALVSHAPHVVASAMAARLADARDTATGLAGPGLRDVTRVAAGDPALWTDILIANAVPVAGVLEALAADIGQAAGALRAFAAGDEPAAKLVTGLLADGVAGRARLPGKRGGPAPSYTVVPVVIRDRPGELARLFQAAGEAGVNIEDVSLEHPPGLPVGVAELSVRPEAAAVLAERLRADGWSVH